MKSRVRKLLVLGCGTALVVAPAVATAPAAAAAAAAAPAGAPVVVVSGLNNPRQLALTDHGRVLVIAEAGRGGHLAQVPSPEGGTTYIGRSGSISAVLFPKYAHDVRPNRIVTGLLSGADQDGSSATGPDGVALGWGNKLYIQETFFPTKSLPAHVEKQNGRLLTAQPYGSTRSFANITAYERANDPDGYGFDSDPYAVLPYRGGHLVADAAANTVLWVGPHGDIHLFHTFFNVRSGACAGMEDPPGFPGCNFVPNTLAVDYHGNVYVGGLSSLTPGEAQIVKLNRHGDVVHRWGGFTSVTGLAVSPSGDTIYASQLLAPESAPPAPQVAGVLTTIKNGHRSNRDVPFPTGLALTHHNLYVSTWSIAPGTGLAGPGTSGQVWRFRV